MNDENWITDRDTYLKYFTGQQEKNSSVPMVNHSIQSEALKNALDIRKFEIDLYWKRAAYFWAFIAASFAGYFALVTKDTRSIDKKSLLLVSILGFIFSYSWYFVNRGSKFWQNNWERHVDYLEKEIMGPLYKTVRNPNQCNFFNPISEYPISVSKINQMLSLMISLIWIYLVYDSIERATKLRVLEIIFIELIGIVVVTFVYWYFGRSKIINHKCKKDTAKFVIRNLE